jgi:hypothetical protein
MQTFTHQFNSRSSVRQKQWCLQFHVFFRWEYSYFFQIRLDPVYDYILPISVYVFILYKSMYVFILLLIKNVCTHTLITRVGHTPLVGIHIYSLVCTHTLLWRKVYAYTLSINAYMLLIVWMHTLINLVIRDLSVHLEKSCLYIWILMEIDLEKSCLYIWDSMRKEQKEYQEMIDIIYG